MINIPKSGIISRVLVRKFTASLIITNYEKLPLWFLRRLEKIAYVINTTEYYPDMICTMDINDFIPFCDKLKKVNGALIINNG